MGGTNVPKPTANRKRRNVVPKAQEDRRLPASGRKGRPPNPPVPLGEHGTALWKELWATPHATTWVRADHRGVAMRCEFEDLWFSGEADPFKVHTAIQQWEDRWGFSPRARATLHIWLDDTPEEVKRPTVVTDIRDRLRDASG